MDVNQNTLNETLAEVLTISQQRRLSTVAKATGFSAQKMMRRGVELVLDIEAPVYLAHAKQAQD